MLYIKKGQALLGVLGKVPRKDSQVPSKIPGKVPEKVPGKGSWTPWDSNALASLLPGKGSWKGSWKCPDTIDLRVLGFSCKQLEKFYKFKIKQNNSMELLNISFP